MSKADNTTADETRREVHKREFPPVPEEAIAKPPEDERPVKAQVRPEEKLDEKEAEIEYLDTENEDMDGDDSPDWDPAVGP